MTSLHCCEIQNVCLLKIAMCTCAKMCIWYEHAQEFPHSHPDLHKIVNTDLTPTHVCLYVCPRVIVFTFIGMVCACINERTCMQFTCVSACTACKRTCQNTRKHIHTNIAKYWRRHESPRWLRMYDSMCIWRVRVGMYTNAYGRCVCEYAFFKSWLLRVNAMYGRKVRESDFVRYVQCYHTRTLIKIAQLIDEYYVSGHACDGTCINTVGPDWCMCVTSTWS